MRCVTASQILRRLEREEVNIERPQLGAIHLRIRADIAR